VAALGDGKNAGGTEHTGGGPDASAGSAGGGAAECGSADAAGDGKRSVAGERRALHRSAGVRSARPAHLPRFPFVLKKRCAHPALALVYLTGQPTGAVISVRKLVFVKKFYFRKDPAEEDASFSL
jgi:hypothetical protein